MVLILNQVHSLDDVGVMQRRRDAEFRSKLLDVILFAFVLATLAELLWKRSVSCHTQCGSKLGKKTHFDGIELFCGLVPFVGQTDNRCCTASDSDLFASAVLLEERCGGAALATRAVFVFVTMF